MINQIIEIVDSKELRELRLEKLIGRMGRIVESLDYPQRKNPGYIVDFSEFSKPFQGEDEWFIPSQSIKTL